MFILMTQEPPFWDENHKRLFSVRTAVGSNKLGLNIFLRFTEHQD